MVFIVSFMLIIIGGAANLSVQRLPVMHSCKLAEPVFDMGETAKSLFLLQGK